MEILITALPHLEEHPFLPGARANLAEGSGNLHMLLPAVQMHRLKY